MKNFQEDIYEEPDEEEVWFQKSWYHTFINKANKYNHHNNEYQEQPLKINWKFPRRHLWGRSVISKKLISHFDMNVFPRVLSILSQQLFLKLQQKNLHRQRFTEWKTALIPQHLLSRMLSIIFRFSCFFQQVSWSPFNVLSPIIWWNLLVELNVSCR